MKYIFLTAILTLLYSCINANASNYKNSSINDKFYFNPNNAYDYIKKQTDLGPRIYGSEARKKVRTFFKEEIKSMGYEVFTHNFDAPYIEGRKGENIYSFLEGESEEYIIVASHYDSRMVAEKDRKI